MKQESNKLTSKNTIWEEVQLNTTDISKSYIKDEFFNYYEIKFLKKDHNESHFEFFQYIIKKTNVLSYVSDRYDLLEGAFVVFKKGENLKTDHLLLDINKAEISKDAQINIFLKMLPLLNKERFPNEHSVFSLTDKLVRNIEIKKNTNDVIEHLVFELYVINGILEINGATFSEFISLKNYFEKNKKIREIEKLNKRTKFWIKESCVWSDKGNDKDLDVVVKMRYSNHKKNTFLLTDYRDRENFYSKINTIYLLIKETMKFKDLFNLEFNIEVFDLCFKDGQKFNIKTSEFNFEEVYKQFISENNVKITFTEKQNINEEIRQKISYISKENIKTVEFKKHKGCDFCIVVLHDESFYKNSDQFDIYTLANKENNQCLTYESYKGANYQKDGILRKLLNELIIKCNIKKLKLEYFSVDYNCSLIKRIKKDGVFVYYGLMVKENILYFSNDINEMLSCHDQEKLSDFFYNEKSEISISSYGKNNNMFLFETAFTDQIISKRLILNLENAKNHREYNKDKNLTRNSRISNYHSNYALGLSGNYYKNDEINKNVFYFVPGLQSAGLNGSLNKSPKMHKCFVIKGERNKDIFKLFDHYYINTHDSVKRSFLNKYIDEKYNLN